MGRILVKKKRLLPYLVLWIHVHVCSTQTHLSLLTFYPSWTFVRLQNSVWDFLGFHFGSGNVGFASSLRIFLVFIYVPIRT